MKAARAIATGVEKTLAAACGAVLAIMLALVMVTAAQRYLLATGYLGAEEASIWLLLLLACLGFPLVAGGPLSMRVDLLANLSGRPARLRDTAAETMVLAACLALVSAGWKAASLTGGTSPMLGLGEWMRPASLAAAGAGALLLRALVLLGEGRWRRLCVAAVLAAIAYAAIVSGARTAALPPSLAAGLVIVLGILVAAPLPHAFVLAGFGALAFGSPLVEPALALQLLSGMGRYLLLAIPFFLLAGGLLIVSGMADDLVRFASALVGRRRSGLGQTVLLTSVLFSGTSGSSIANAAFASKTFFRPLVANRYPPERAGGIIAATSVLDNVIPPSIAFFILATATNLPVGRLLVGGLVAGLVMAAALFLTIHLTGRGDADRPPTEPMPLWRLAARALPVFGLGLIIVAGIRFGVVTPTEAAGLAAAYTLVAALLSRAPKRGIAGAFAQAGIETAAIVMLIGAATPLAFLLATDGVTAAAARLAVAFGENPFLVMLAANLLLLIVGLMLDIGAAIVLFGPILLPVAVAVGIDPVHFGVILIVNLMIGGLTPPVGILVQVVSAGTGVPAIRLFRSVLPHLAGLLAALALMSVAIAAYSQLT